MTSPTKPLRLLIVTQHYHPETMATGRRARELAEDFAAAGHHVTVLTGQPNHPASVGRGVRRQPAVERPAPRLEIRRVSVLSDPGAAHHRRLLTYASFAGAAVIRGVLARRRFAAVIAISPLPTGVAAAIIAATRRAPLVFDLQDVWPESATIAGAVRQGPAYGLLEWVERALYRRCTAVTVITHGFERRLVARGIDPARVHFIPNGVDTDLFRSNIAASKRPGYTIAFAGNMGLMQDLDTALDAAKLLAGEAVRFILVGDGVRRPHVRQRVAAESISNVELLASQPREQIPGLLASADAALVCLIDRPLFEITIPSKVYEAMAAARPILCGVAGETSAMVEEIGCGVTYRPGEPASLAAAVRRLRSADGEALGRRGREWVEAHATRSMVTRRFLDVVERIAR